MVVVDHAIDIVSEIGCDQNADNGGYDKQDACDLDSSPHDGSCIGPTIQVVKRVFPERSRMSAPL
jgi:hypothetical protein